MQLERVGQFMTGKSSTIHHVLARLLVSWAAILCPMTRCYPVPDTMVDGININIQGSAEKQRHWQTVPRRTSGYNVRFLSRGFPNPRNPVIGHPPLNNNNNSLIIAPGDVYSKRCHGDASPPPVLIGRDELISSHLISSVQKNHIR
jgi:hypothetical protein